MTRDVEESTLFVFTGIRNGLLRISHFNGDKLLVTGSRLGWKDLNVNLDVNSGLILSMCRISLFFGILMTSENRLVTTSIVISSMGNRSSLSFPFIILLYYLVMKINLVLHVPTSHLSALQPLMSPYPFVIY